MDFLRRPFCREAAFVAVALAAWLLVALARAARTTSVGVANKYPLTPCSSTSPAPLFFARRVRSRVACDEACPSHGGKTSPRPRRCRCWNFSVRVAVYVCTALPRCGFCGRSASRTSRSAGLARGTWANADARALLAGQLLVAGWCWSGCTIAAIGGGWRRWFEHGAHEIFLDTPLTRNSSGTIRSRRARPGERLNRRVPVVYAVDFAHYQLISTLLASLSFLRCVARAPLRPHGGAIFALRRLFMLRSASPETPLRVDEASRGGSSC